MSALAATTFSQLGDHLAAVHLQPAASTPHHATFPFVELSSLKQRGLTTSWTTSREIENQDRSGGNRARSPLRRPPLCGPSTTRLYGHHELLDDDGITIRIAVDNVDTGAGPHTCMKTTSLAMPHLSIVGSFYYLDASSPPASFMGPWRSCSTHQFTFTAEPQSSNPQRSMSQAASTIHVSAPTSADCSFSVLPPYALSSFKSAPKPLGWRPAVVDT